VALASSHRDFAESPLDIYDEQVSDEPIAFKLKYIGTTVMKPSVLDDCSNKKIKLSKKSQLITTRAIKTVINTSKNLGKPPEVNVLISPKGIEAFDATSKKPLLEVPIYNISYCSIDAEFDTIFAFVSSKNENLEQQLGVLRAEDELVLHAFQCHKKKIAHNVTLTVAR
jgi:Phosphotyrosine interaction domain (PTB/PID)